MVKRSHSSRYTGPISQLLGCHYSGHTSGTWRQCAAAVGFDGLQTNPMYIFIIYLWYIYYLFIIYLLCVDLIDPYLLLGCPLQPDCTLVFLMIPELGSRSFHALHCLAPLYEDYINHQLITITTSYIKLYIVHFCSLMKTTVAEDPNFQDYPSPFNSHYNLVANHWLCSATVSVRPYCPRNERLCWVPNIYIYIRWLVPKLDPFHFLTYVVGCEWCFGHWKKGPIVLQLKSRCSLCILIDVDLSLFFAMKLTAQIQLFFRIIMLARILIVVTKPKFTEFVSGPQRNCYEQWPI